jgi:Rrf2 family protein
MQIRRETDYAIRCVLHLSQSPDQVIMVNEIARSRRIPRSFLSKILQKLAKAGIVESLRGVKGGFRLTRRPEDISLLDVIEAIEGPVAMNHCAINRRLCSLSKSCSVHPVWIVVREKVEGILREHNFARLAYMSKSP